MHLLEFTKINVLKISTVLQFAFSCQHYLVESFNQSFFSIKKGQKDFLPLSIYNFVNPTPKNFHYEVIGF